MASPEVKPQKRVALVIAERDGLVLFGKRRDNGRWTLPGGHVEDGEEPAAAARRELKEEAGLEPKGELREVDHRVNGPIELWTYRCEVEGAPTGKGDPDEECELWAFLDASEGIPKPVAENMAGPKDPDKNVAADVLGLAKTDSSHQEKSLRIPIGNIFKLNRWGHPLRPERFDYQLKHGGTSPPVKVSLGTSYEESNPDYVHAFDPQDEAIEERFDHSAHLDPAHPRYFLSDGHHRVAAARERGETHVDAHVEIPTAPSYLRGDKKAAWDQEMSGEVAKLSAIRDSAGLAKMAIADIPPGKRTAAGSYDYDHVLTPEHRDAGYTLDVHEDSGTADDGGPDTPFYVARLRHKGLAVGHVMGMLYGDQVEPHSVLFGSHRGRGLGQKMYEALYRHAMLRGIKRVAGGGHSEDAARVHQALARKHGLQYEPESYGRAPSAGLPHGQYDYVIKDELPMAKAVPTDPHEIHPTPAGYVRGNQSSMSRNGGVAGYDYSHHLSEQDRTAGHRLIGYSDLNPLAGVHAVPHVAWVNPVDHQWAGKKYATPSGSGWSINETAGMKEAPQSVRDAATQALSQHIDMAKPLEALERVRQAQTGQGWGSPGAESEHGPLHQERAVPDQPQVRRIHNRFVGTKATEKTSGLGTSRRPMAERLAFDYSHHLTPEQRAQGLTLTVYDHPEWRPVPMAPGRNPRSREYAAAQSMRPVVELLHNGKDPGIAFPSGVSGAMAAKNAALTEHEANAKRMVGPEWKQQRYLDTLPLPPQGERAQLLEIDQPKRRRAAKAKPAAPALIDQDLAARAKNLETGEGVQPLQVPPHREMSNDERHLLWDYSHLLSPEDRAAGRRLEIRHTPGRFDDYMHANYFDYHDPTASRTAWAYPRTMDDLSFNSTAGQAPNPAITEAMRRAYAHHRQLHLRGQLEPVIQNVQGSRFANLELSERAMIKAEADEVDRLLTHPDPAERTMALKLAGVRGRHLARAFGDSDPAVRRAALRHPALDRHALLQLMQTPGMADAQLAALAHPRIGREHIEALYHTAKQDPGPDRLRLLHAVSHHGLLDAPLIERMHAEGNGDATVENLNTPPHVVDRIVESHLADPRDDRKRALARRALKHPKISASLVERAWKEGTGDVRIAVAQSQHLPEALAQDALQRGLRPEGDSEALLRSFIVNNPKATEAHLKTAAKDRNPLVRHQARSKLGLTKFESQHAAFLGEQLAKATRPDDLKSIARATDPSGASVVDHSLEYDAHPPEHAADVAAYREAVLRGPATVRRTGTKVNAEGTDSGVTRKVIYTVPANHPTHGGVRYMVKPYHERIIRRAKSWMRHPHQGWSEMTNQALYHAGGIGDLHQGVHVSEHDMGPGREHEPALVVRIDPGYQDIDHAVAGSYHRGNPQFPEHVREQARRISLMDMLTNNLDRHFGNLLYRDAGGASQSLLAIDHPRSFQYVSTARDMNRPMRTKATGGHDRFSDYVNGSALRELNPLERSNDVSDNIATINRWQPTFDWWADHSDAIKKAFEQRLRLIKDPEIRAHLSRNFHARARWLDQRAHFGLAQHGQDWYDDEVPMYRPGEISEEERDALMDPEGQS